MTPSTSLDGKSPAIRLVAALALLWLAGIALRVTILAVPPVIPMIHDDFHMTESQVGVLIGLPLVMFALAAIPGSLLIARFGAFLTMTVGMVITALAAAGRGAAPNLLSLYAATAAMGFGVAIMQPALPTLVKEWVPQRRVGLATAVSTNGLMVGVAAAPALSIPLVLPLVEQSWRWGFVVWAVPALLAALLFIVFAPRTRSHTPNQTAAAKLWWPDWKNPLIWLLGLTFGSNNALYYGVNAFLADYLNSQGQANLIGPAVGFLNICQFIASILLLATAERLQRRAWPYLVFGPLALAGVIGIIIGSGYWVVLAAGLVGFSLAATFVLTMALPPVLSPAEDIHRLAGGMFTISYTCAVIIPILCGAFWDLTGIPWTAFIPVGLCGITLTALGFFLSMRRSAA
jgi:MFS transporter, CP family, cyanate transporter